MNPMSEKPSQLKEWVESLLRAQGIEGRGLDVLSWLAVALGVILLAVAVNFLVKRALLGILRVAIRRTKTKWDDALLDRHVLQRASHVAPALVFYWFAAAFPGAEAIIQRLAMVYMLVVGGLVASSLLDAMLDVYETLEASRNRPIKGFVQILKLIVYLALGIVVVAVMFNQSPFGLLGGLGALTAVLMLVFKDPILGLVASFQISGSNIVRMGDWIEMPKYGADGDVVDISLLQIRVQNWDKTISTIPTYALVSDSFRNWRGMSESGGRRIKRAVHIDMQSIRFCTEEMLERFRRYQYLAEYIDRKRAELAEHNTASRADLSQPVNGRRLTNVGTFRAYVAAYLRHHPKVHQEMTFLVRHLPPGPTGLPLEIYVFANDQQWAAYEAIQADIFDHILAVVPHFDLRVFQSPSGHDVRALAELPALRGNGGAELSGEGVKLPVG